MTTNMQTKSSQTTDKRSIRHLVQHWENRCRKWFTTCNFLSSSLPERMYVLGWHHWLDGHESEWTLGVSDGQGGLACCNSWGHKELDTTEWLNWTEEVLILKTSIAYSNFSLMYQNVAWYKLTLVDSGQTSLLWEARFWNIRNSSWL